MTQQWFESPYYKSVGLYPPSCLCDNTTATHNCIVDVDTEQSIYNKVRNGQQKKEGDEGKYGG